MKRHNLLYFALLLSLISWSCSDDFLDKKSLTGSSNETFWQTPEDAMMGLAACYDGLQNGFLYNGGPWENGFFFMDAMTDNGGHFNWDGWMAGYDITNGIHTPSSWQVGDFWKASYEVINRCNALITRIEGIDMDASKKATYKAEAIAIRALMYLNLTMTYQDVPFLTQDRGMDEAETGKTDRATIVDAIITDLKEAADALPVEPESRGHITRGAAWSLLGRVALYNEKWEVAIEYYNKVMTLGYDLADDYAALFTREGEADNEVIFGVRFEGPGLKEGSSFAAHWDTPLEAINGSLDLAKAYHCTDGLPTHQSPLYEEGENDLQNNRPDALRYNNRDPRLKATLFVPGMKWGNNTAEFYGGAAASRSTVYVYKYFDPFQSSSDSWDSGQDFYVIRYAEVLLSLAEAMVQKGDYVYADVTHLINEVRARVDMPSVEEVEGTALDRDALLALIKHERRVETAFEGLRLFDLYRWKELKQAVDNIEAERSLFSGIHQYFLYEQRNYRGEKEYVWPIPLAEVDANKNIDQHPLWK
ncbi:MULTISPECIES: RagB/SusD family nutrient uptake outer membrane protein [unclassified Carboxylicivirga]|uniref:RagB/SusD family nutrient uptake outer membrane protein n=1 Tax=Carboxylicivirga TaxID=1628153 RepID=UPI003D332BEF